MLIYGIPYGTKVKIDKGASGDLIIYKAKNLPISIIDILISDDCHQLFDANFSCDSMPAYVISDSLTGKVYVEPDFHTDGTFQKLVNVPEVQCTDQLRGYLLMDKENGLKYIYTFYEKSVPSAQYLEICAEVIRAMDFSLIKRGGGESYDEIYTNTVFDLFGYFKLTANRNLAEVQLQIPMRMVSRRDKSNFFQNFNTFRGGEYQIYCLMLDLFRKNRTAALTKDGTLDDVCLLKYKSLINTIFQKIRE